MKNRSPYRIVQNRIIAWLKSHNKFYVYVLRCDGVLFYIGKGRGGRMFRHADEAQKRSLPVHNFIKKMSPLSVMTHEIVAFFDDELSALNLEAELIKKYGRKDKREGPLKNLTDGGLQNAGRIPSPEWRANKSREMKQKLSNPENHPRYGVTLSQATKAKISKSLTGKKASIATRIKQSMARAGRPNPMSDAQKVKLSLARDGKVSWSYYWKVVSPSGSVSKVFNLKEFCRDHHLNQGNMYQVAKGKKKADKGWVCEKISQRRFTAGQMECLSELT